MVLRLDGSMRSARSAVQLNGGGLGGGGAERALGRAASPHLWAVYGGRALIGQVPGGGSGRRG